MVFRSPSATSFSTRSGSEVLARKARQKASCARQKARQDQASTNHSMSKWLFGYPSEARQERVDSFRRSSLAATGARKAFMLNLMSSSGNVTVLPPDPSSSPIKRGIQYICNNFIPDFVSPSKAVVSTGPISSGAHTGPRLSPTAHVSSQFFEQGSSGFLADESMTNDSYMGSASGCSISTSGTPTPFGHCVRANTVNELGQLHTRVEESDIDRTHEKRAWIIQWLNEIQYQEAIGIAATLSEEDLQEEIEVQQSLEFPSNNSSEPHALVPSSGRTGRYDPYGRAAAKHGHASITYRSAETFVLLYAQYERDWKFITDNLVTALTFETIPWPLLFTPIALTDITADRVHEFIHFAGCTTTRTIPSPSLLRKAARHELLRGWSDHKFAELVLVHVFDDKEAEVVRSAAAIVQDALKEYAI